MKNYFYAGVLLALTTLGLVACGSNGGGGSNNSVAAASSCVAGQYYSPTYGCLYQGICAQQGPNLAQDGNTCVPATPVTCNGGYGTAGYPSGYNNGYGSPFGTNTGYGTTGVCTAGVGIGGIGYNGIGTTGIGGIGYGRIGTTGAQLGAGGCPSTLYYAMTQQYGPVCVDPNNPSRYWVLQNMSYGQSYGGGVYYGGGYNQGYAGYNPAYYNQGFHAGVSLQF